MAFTLSLLSLLFAGTYSDGLIFRTDCTDAYCSQQCTDRDVHEQNFRGGNCFFNGAYSETFACLGGIKFWHMIYPDPHCNEEPIQIYTDGKCYTGANGGSSFYRCVNGKHIGRSLGNEYGKDSNQESRNNESYLYVVGVVVVLMVLLCGIFGGYLVFRKRRKLSVERDQLLEA